MPTTLVSFLSEREQAATGGSSPDATSASITRSQWQHFLDTYRPVEDDVLASALQTDFTREGNEAGATAVAGVNSARGTLQRNLSRSGQQLTGEERSAVNRRANLSLAKAAGRAENTTRRGLSDSRSELLAGAVGIGRGVSRTASSGLQSVADLAAQREALYRQQRTQANNINLSSAASAAALLIAV